MFDINTRANSKYYLKPMAKYISTGSRINFHPRSDSRQVYHIKVYSSLNDRIPLQTGFVTLDVERTHTPIQIRKVFVQLWVAALYSFSQAVS